MNSKKAVQGYETKPVVGYSQKQYYYPDHGVTVTAETQEEADKKLLSLTADNAKGGKGQYTSKSDE